MSLVDGMQLTLSEALDEIVRLKDELVRADKKLDLSNDGEAKLQAMNAWVNMTDSEKQEFITWLNQFLKYGPEGQLPNLVVASTIGAAPKAEDNAERRRLQVNAANQRAREKKKAAAATDYPIKDTGISLLPRKRGRPPKVKPEEIAALEIGVDA